MSLFGALYIGDSGLRTSQNALNTTAHNLSNLNTVGYVRQQVANSDTTYTNTQKNMAGYNVQIGDGVKYADCRHVRDMFLDRTYREESGRYSFYETSYAAILEIEDIMGEFEDAAFSKSVSGLWSAMQELSKHPNDTVNMSTLVQKCASFIENATSVYRSFIEYQNNLNKQVKDSVNDINEIGKRIVALNKEISRIEVGGVESANDLRDERDLLLDTLAGYGNIEYEEDKYSVVTVRFNGTDFVTGNRCYEMGMLTDDSTGFVTPYWPHNVIWVTDENGERVQDFESAKVFNLTEEISTAKNTDVGSLRGLLLARGDHIANYTDVNADVCTQAKLDKLGITAEQYNEEYGKKYYNKEICNSIIMNVEAEFDHLVHAIATKVNEVMAQACDPVSGYLCNENGTPMQMFQKLLTDPYTHVMTSVDDEKLLKEKIDAGELIESGAKILDKDGKVVLVRICDEKGNPIPNNYWKFNQEDPDVAFSLYNCTNMDINLKLVQTPALLGFKYEDDSADYNIGKAFVEAFQKDGIYLNPNATAMSTFENCYSNLMSQVSSSGNVYKLLYEYEQLAVEQADNERQTVIGVSSDEELERMIMYKNAYNAASRYINVVNSMLDVLLSMAS